MANVKISALPSYTGSAADLRWFVMNNSGENETYKFSGYTAPYRWSSSNSGITEVNTTKSSQFNTRGGTNTETANSYSNFVVGTGNTIGSTIAQHTIFGEGNTATGGNNSVGCFIFGRNNTATNANNRWGAIFGNGNSIGQTGYAFGDNINAPGLFSLSVGTNIINAGENSLAIGDNSRVITPYNFSIGIDNDIEAGNYNGMYGGNGGRNNSGSYNGFLGGLSNTNNTSSYGGFIGGQSNTITGSGSRNVMVGGISNTISGKTDAIMLGTSGRTADASNTTYVENLKIFGQAQSQSNNVGSVSTGTRTLDFNTGNIQYFQLTSGSTIVLDATNYKDGATYIVKVKQPSSGTNATMTFTSPLFKFPNGIAPTLSTGNDEEDILSFICIGATLYGNIQKTFI